VIAGCSASVIVAICSVVVIAGTKVALDKFQINFNALPNHMKYNLIS
jgi:hypothetical protein